MVISESNGSEPWIFRASEPDELVGAHRLLMASALVASEPARYLLYSPSWQGRGRHFGINALPASHALVVTDKRFIITRDSHDGSPPRVTSIPFETVLAVEKGSALLLAWFAVRFVVAAESVTFTILHKSTGAHHFDAVVRSWRQTLPSLTGMPSLHADEHWKSVPRFLYYEIEPILIDGERIHGSLHAQERWTDRKRLFRVQHTFVQPWSSTLLTDRSVVIGTAEQPLEPATLAFGANVTIIPYRTITACEVAERSVRGVHARELRIDASLNGSGFAVVAPFDGSAERGESAAAVMRSR